jgi:hypothetical protein
LTKKRLKVLRGIRPVAVKSKLLAVVWQMKSENIYFEGEKSIVLKERLKTFVERSKDQLGLERPVEELLSEEGDQNADNECNDEQSESEEAHFQSNGDSECVKTPTTKQCGKFGKDNLLTESLTYEKSMCEQSSDPNLHDRSSTLDKLIAGTKDTSNPRVIANSIDDSEINMLNFKLERFTNKVAARLDDLAFEINAMKENKAYSIITLEEVIKELKEEKAELYRKNEELRESNTNMRQTILQLNQANKQLEDETSSLMTVVKIIQHDLNQQHTEAKASSNITIGNDENVWEKPKSKHQSKSPPILIQDDARPETSNRYQVFDVDLNPSAGSNFYQRYISKRTGSFKLLYSLMTGS